MFLVYIFHTLPKLFVSFGNDFKHPNQHSTHVGQNQRFLVVYRHCGESSNLHDECRYQIKDLSLWCPILPLRHRAPHFPKNQGNLLDFPSSNGCLLALIMQSHVDIISLKQFTHIHRHSTNVTYAYVLCAMIHVCHCRHQHLYNWAFNACVRACVCVWGGVGGWMGVYSLVKIVCFHAIRLCILV